MTADEECSGMNHTPLPHRKNIQSWKQLITPFHKTLQHTLPASNFAPHPFHCSRGSASEALVKEVEEQTFLSDKSSVSFVSGVSARAVRTF